MVDRLDIPRRTITVTRARVDYYTRVRGHKLTEILDINKQIYVSGTKAYEGSGRTSKDSAASARGPQG